MMARGLSPHVELLRVSAPPAPPPTPPPPEEEEEGGMDSDEESLAAARVPKAELLLRLFTTGRGFRRLLYSSFLQNALGQQPELRALHHVTEGPYVHACFLEREPVCLAAAMYGCCYIWLVLAMLYVAVVAV